MTLLSSYIVTAFRSVLKMPLYTLINVAGLASGIACVLLIMLYLEEELSYDRFHANAENLYRITWSDNNPQTRTPHPMAQAMKADFPEVESAVSLTPLYAAGLTRETHSFRNPASDIRYDEKNILAVDTTFFKVFSFPLVRGNPENALHHVDGILLSESMAEKYFPGQDPVGKHLAVDAENYLVEVVGVFKDVPENAHFRFDFLVSYLREKSQDQADPFYSWADFGHYNYVRLRDCADAKVLEEKLMPWMRKFIDIPEANYKALVDQSYGFRLQPVTDIHLHSRLRWELGTNGNIEYIYILATAALLTLVIAAANFINLTTARSADRAREIGVRKTMGATQRQLSMQFLMESIILALAAAALGMLIAELALPLINAITGTSFAFNYGRHGVLLLALSLLIGTLSGLYPSAWLSAIAPQRVLKGKQVSAPGGFRLQNGLIVFQFAMSMVLISSAVILYHQLNYLREKDPGFDKEALVVIPVKAESGLKRFDVLQHELLQVEGVVAASATSNLPGGQFNQHHLATTAFPEEDIPISEAFVDYDFFRVMDIPFVQGREFMRGNPADSVAFVLNESAVRALNLEGPPVGQEIWWIRHEEGARMRGTVIGVVQDFHFQSLHEHIRPLLFKLTESRFNHIIARVRTENTGQVLDSMKEIYKKFEPVYAFEPAFLEDTLDAQYASEQRMGLVLAIFTGVAIVIACVGLFGISLLTFHHKTRELSIRKVLGADVADILVQVLGAFTRLILIAVGVAIPLAWWIMNQWLENFSYQVSIAPSVFLIAGAALVGIAWLTMGYFTYKALKLNPVDTLKSE